MPGDDGAFSADDPLTSFAARLREYRKQSNEPSLRDLERLTRNLGHRCPRMTITAKLNAESKPSWEFVQVFVQACARHARKTLKQDELDNWHDAYQEMLYQLEAAKHGPEEQDHPASGSAVVPPTDAFVRVRDEYLKRLRQRYRRVELEVLTPLTEGGESPTMLLGEVFVPQLARANPPPVELPRELRRRLAAAGEVNGGDTPESVDRREIEQARKAYQDRPALPVLEIVASPGGQKLVLLGDPGAGKSTLARYLVMTLADMAEGGAAPVDLAPLADCLPLLVELRTYADPQWRYKTFLDLIDHLYEVEGLGLPRRHLEGYLRRGGSAVVIFDGLDEVFEPGLREQVTRQIDGFGARYPQVRVIVTSRATGYQQQRAILDAVGFAHYMLQDLTPKQIEAFAGTWYQVSCLDDPAEALRLRERLLDAVRNSAAVAELAGNPMLLTILAIIGRRKELPRERRAAYEHAVTVLVEQWDSTAKHLADHRADGGMPDLDAQEKLELLRLVARRMQEGKGGLAGNNLPSDKLFEEFVAYFKGELELAEDRARSAARILLAQLRERNFILAWFGAGVYGFVHRAFLEYLAADDIFQRFSRHEMTEGELIAVFQEHWRDPAWQEVLLLLAGMIPEAFAGQVIDALLAADPLWYQGTDPLPRHVLLAVGCLGEVRKRGRLTARSHAVAAAVISLLETVSEPFDYVLGMPVAQALERSALPVLASLGPNWAGRARYCNWYRIRGQFLGGTFPGSARSIAARIYVALIGTDGPARKVLRGLAEHGNPETIRGAAIQALAAGWHDEADTASWLRKRAVEDQSWYARRAAVQALAAGWHDEAGTASWLRKRAVEDADPEVRAAAIQALAADWHEDADTAPWLRERAVEDRDPEVRAAAIQALAADRHDDPQTVELLRRRAAEDARGSVCAAAVQALAAGQRDEAGTVLWLRECAVHHQVAEVRRAALHALAAGLQDGPEADELLRERAVEDEDPEVRGAAVQALAAGWHDDADIAPWLRKRIVDDKHANVRATAVQALSAGWHDDPHTPRLLRQRAVDDPDWYVRGTAVQALTAGWHDEPQILGLLRRRAVEDENWSVRRGLVRALAAGWHDDPATASWLRERIMRDSGTEVRGAALLALAVGWHDDPATVAWVRERATNDQSWQVRRAALQALATGWESDPDTAVLLRQRATDDRTEDVRGTALQALAIGWHDDPSIPSWLQERAIADRHWQVRRTALQALAGGWPDDPATASWFRERADADPDPEVRAAAQACGEGSLSRPTWTCGFVAQQIDDLVGHRRVVNEAPGIAHGEERGHKVYRLLGHHPDDRCLPGEFTVHLSGDPVGQRHVNGADHDDRPLDLRAETPQHPQIPREHLHDDPKHPGEIVAIA